MCGPNFEYTLQDYINDAEPHEWAEWEKNAYELELPIDYYILEFVACDS